MFANRYTALIDACCLAGALRRNLLLSLAEAEFFRPVWSATILEETRIAIVRMLVKRNADALGAEQKSKLHIAAIRKAFPEAEIAAFEDLLGVGSHLPDPDDAHVLAAAIKSQASTIITDNLDDFPTDILSRHNIEARSADDFIADTVALDEAKAVEVVRTMRNRFARPEITSEELLRKMEAQGLVQTVDILGPHLLSL